jgi:CMP-N-acetylneuraminic acid synthetase
MLAIIPAKKKSKRLPNKNIKLFAKEPLIAHKIKSELK